MEKIFDCALLSRGEVGEKLGISPATVSRLVKAGELEAVRVGERFVRITETSLTAYLGRKAVNRE